MKFAAGLAWFVSVAGAQELDVISIKPTPAARLYQLKRECTGGRLVAAGMPLSFVIEWAYRIDEAQLLGTAAMGKGLGCGI